MSCDEKIKSIIYVRKGKAKNNFLKHIRNNNITAIKKQIKRGSVTITKLHG
jgi:hypothetical protein